MNADCNRHFKTNNARWVKVAPDSYGLNQPQSFWIHNGLEMIGCVRTSGKVKNNLRYTVQDHSDDNQIKLLSQTGNEIELDIGTLSKQMRLAFCVTGASCQGQEYDKLAIWDLKSAKMTRRLLYVLLSRAKDGQHLWAHG